MNVLQRTLLVVLLLIGANVLIAVPASSRAGSTKITGRIIAYRLADRIAQMASYVPNKEVFLFLTEGPVRDKKPTILKINYIHFELSDITTDILDGSQLLEMKVSRDRNCDESYDHFVSTAPGIGVVDATLPVDRMPDLRSARALRKPIEFTGGFDGTGLSPQLKLHCYALKKSGFRLVNQTTGGWRTQ